MKYKNNPFNIRKGSSRWLGSISKQGDKFESFDTLEHGIRAFFIIMRSYSIKYGRNTIRSIITRFAPPSENNVDAYINFISNAIKKAPDDQLKSCLDYIALAKFMAFYESRTHIPRVTIIEVWIFYHISNKSFPLVKGHFKKVAVSKCETTDDLPF